MAIESECGETLELKGVHDASVSNPANLIEAHELLKKSWQRFSAAADRDKLTYYGMRVVEPHVIEHRTGITL